MTEGKMYYQLCTQDQSRGCGRRDGYRGKGFGDQVFLKNLPLKK